MESIVQFRQMMAEQKFLEVQKLIEVQLSLSNECRHELLSIYYTALKSLDKTVPHEVLMELAELESQKKNHDFVFELISKVSSEKYYQKTILLKLQAAEDHGRIDRIYDNLSEFLIHQFEHQLPHVPLKIADTITRYFKFDFNLRLKLLALKLLTNDLESSEKLLKELIESCVEKSSPKGTKEKLSLIAEVLLSSTNKFHLEIYQSFCLLSVNGIREKSDFKKIVEMIIFFEDFKFQVLTLNLLYNLELREEAAQYAQTVRMHKDYDFVYFDKFFPHLKSLFVETKVKAPSQPPSEILDLDLKLAEKPQNLMSFETMDSEESEEERRFLSLLKYQTYSSNEYCELAVSFLQSELPRVALKAAESAIRSSLTDDEYLKGSYLKLTSLLLLNDNRSALDTCLEALKRSRSTEDVLSFLYGQAEALIRLNKKKEARKTLQRVLMIDPNYRMARERLEKL